MEKIHTDLTPQEESNKVIKKGYFIIYTGFEDLLMSASQNWNPPSQVTLPEWFVLRSQLRVLGSKHLSQQLHHLQPLIIIITLQTQGEGE